MSWWRRLFGLEAKPEPERIPEPKPSSPPPFKSPSPSQNADAPATLAREVWPSKVAGVSFSNPDGGSRQQIIRSEARAGATLRLVREDNNPVDTQAIAVHLTTPAWPQIGFLNRNLARQVRDWLADGDKVIARITEITGGAWAYEFYGVNIEIEVFGPIRAPVRGPSELQKLQVTARQAGNWKELQALLSEEVAFREHEGSRYQMPVRPIAHERLASFLRKQGLKTAAVEILERYCALPTADDRHKERVRAKIGHLKTR